ncbi:transmembrane protein 244-like [Hydractinia symbiolongicarpus]|uniref:transmembrane protein 244-like n=1 Tax=Hydractinia symbiolongicarpus TaxID=13093 RepID=UPI00254A4ED4|nr:transmembrane protein 244-like [Hydractinia symbiolongicarpus]
MPSNSKVIAATLLVFTGIFYVMFYCMASLASGSFSLKPFNKRMPFDFNQCCFTTPAKHAHSFAMITTFLLSCVIFMLQLKEKLWDYVLSLIIIHVLVSSIVMQEFPRNWEWWTLLVSSGGVSILVGESFIYVRYKKNKNRTDKDKDPCT